MAKKKRGQDTSMPIPIGNNQRIVIQDVSTMVNQEKRITRVEMMFFFVLTLLVVFVFFGDAIKAWLGSMTWWQKLVDNTPDWIKDNVPASPSWKKDSVTGKIPLESAVLFSLAGLATTLLFGYGAFVLFRRRRAGKVLKEKLLDFGRMETEAGRTANLKDVVIYGRHIARLLEDDPKWERATKKVTRRILDNIGDDEEIDPQVFLDEVKKEFKKRGGWLPWGFGTTEDEFFDSVSREGEKLMTDAEIYKAVGEEDYKDFLQGVEEEAQRLVDEVKKKGLGKKYKGVALGKKEYKKYQSLKKKSAENILTMLEAGGYKIKKIGNVLDLGDKDTRIVSHFKGLLHFYEDLAAKGVKTSEEDLEKLEKLPTAPTGKPVFESK